MAIRIIDILIFIDDAAGRKLRVEHLLNTLAALDPVIGPPGVITRVQSAVPSAHTGGTGKTNVPAHATLLVRDYCGDHVYCNDTLEEVNSYYPYGMLHGPSAIAASVQPLKFMIQLYF